MCSVDHLCPTPIKINGKFPCNFNGLLDQTDSLNREILRTGDMKRRTMRWDEGHSKDMLRELD